MFRWLGFHTTKDEREAQWIWRETCLREALGVLRTRLVELNPPDLNPILQHVDELVKK